MNENRYLVIIPTYNELQNLPIITAAVRAAAPHVDILVADDNSPDGTGALADSIAAQDPQIHVLHRTAKNGLGAAYIAGFQWGIDNGYTHVIEMDADGSHRAEDLVKLLAAADKGADLVLGSRYVRGGKTVNWPWHRQLLSRGGNMYINIMLGARVRDMTGGFRVFRVDLLPRLNLDTINARGYTFQTEMAWRARKAGATIVEVPITFVERIYGESKMDGNIVKEALLLVTKWGIQHRLGIKR